MSSSIIKLTNFKLSVADRILIDNSSDEDCDFLVNPGDVVLLVGSNGSGKTTLLKRIIGTADTKQRKTIKIENHKVSIKQDGVKLEYKEKLINGMPIEDGILDEVGIALNDTDLKIVIDDSSTMKEYLNDVLKGKYKENIDEINRLFKLFYGEKYHRYLKAKIGKCSSGEQKKLSIIGALIRQNKKLYFFDEPMNCLDTKTMINFMNEIENLKQKQPESAIVIITHCLLFDNPSKVYKISNGKLIDDTKNYKKRDCLDYLMM